MTDPDILIIGAGPAGLMAAEAAAMAGASVLVADQMPSPARKFLMAGKSGLNLTNTVPKEQFLAAFGDNPVAAHVARFSARDVMDWAEGLGQPLFTGSTGRVFPRAMKASPLLRAWLARLDGLGVRFRTRWRWDSSSVQEARFDTQDGPFTLHPRATVLALGGASWSRLGSDGAWAARFAAHGLVAPFAPSNAALSLHWSPHMTPHFGAPVKNTALLTGDQIHRGEFVVSARGLEGGGIYPLTPWLRDGGALTLDLKPDWSLDRVAEQLARAKGSVSNRLRKGLRLSPVQIALAQEFGRPLPADLAPLIKSLPIRHNGPRPLDEAISTAGGLRFDALTQDLMLHESPGVFACGEMLDWEAPTGGYLLTACLATGRSAGQAAAQWVQATANSER
ncbi:TIGR03862 family flavoprotein [Palleronia caenipelagi]|uniref:TIGR03862 family flavoprotein n=1 Tax=Palleronia caenipelagi TaxID=2489174 RepID=A0A547Q6Q4_9RHOB|nr:TIGR03862 family flavoprotein [Palleronia caenipelagi]TRD22059.1 TIGR03862 family flavoprotein [Palleronia caenipelagi]